MYQKLDNVTIKGELSMHPKIDSHDKDYSHFQLNRFRLCVINLFRFIIQGANKSL